MNIFEHNDHPMFYTQHGDGDTVFIWAHGWGTNHKTLLPLSQSLTKMGRHYVLDLPGFGQSPPPKTVWGAADYAEYIHEFIKSLKARKIVWIGHSFGCRIGVKYSALYAKDIDRLIIIAGAGLPAKRSLCQKMRMIFWVSIFKTLKVFANTEEKLEKLKSKYGSADYRNAGDMRQIFIKTIGENLTGDALKIECPVALYYGDKDTETKPDIGIRYDQLIQNSQLEIFEGYDHYTILTKGLHQLTQRIHNFVKNNL